MKIEKEPLQDGLRERSSAGCIYVALHGMCVSTGTGIRSGYHVVYHGKFPG